MQNEKMVMHSPPGSKPRLWCVLALTVGAAIAIVAGIASQTPKFPAIALFAAER
jgi:hypothetical protein